jgi:hypothetical protein
MEMFVRAFYIPGKFLHWHRELMSVYALDTVSFNCNFHLLI